MSELDPQALAKLDQETRQELSQWAQKETEKAQLQQNVHRFTDMCWKKCITEPATSGSLTSQEESCITNCLQRFFDTNSMVVQLVQRKAL
ncbi:hypothetical protein CANCADRAFT_103059 [Tortispora caseinolytica NRRL Y-17796]|uniref:Mitochondrial import inner membrane translocase subunit n=1 Tax=Tortispora caseinolytica NRRL Y-17796 TaxID=767744 RepID=A0A1E4TEN8_9ASCO|nr:hypothetical protein CANCADRAFT_103059 [Tortispora caseinolytica NRRL Y-17796]